MAIRFPRNGGVFVFGGMKVPPTSAATGTERHCTRYRLHHKRNF